MKLTSKLGILLIASAGFIACETDDNGLSTTTDDDGSANLELDNSLFATSNTSGDITVYDVEDIASVTASTFGTAATDTEGIYYDSSDDEVIQISRSESQIQAFGDLSLNVAGIALNASVSSTASLSSPRDLAVNDNIYVVADNADVDGDDSTDDGRLFIYTRGDDGSITLRNTVTVNFAVWGIEFDGDTLIAVVDKTSDVAIFENFADSNTTDATVEATKTITIEGIVRTHGLAVDGGTLILTDVGSATDDADGAFHIISDYASKFASVANGETLAVVGNQVRVAGDATFLGNPVAAEYDAESNVVFIAERANGGGRILAFSNAQAGGNLTPSVNNELEGASSLYLNE